MDETEFDESTVSRRQKSLIHLASIDPMDLCNEAKVERCRATRDLRICGRHVQRVLVSCGHAALCEECSQRCDICPICRTPLANGRHELPLRLYYECVEAGLISKRDGDIAKDQEDGENQLIADIQRLYSLFDVALENNLVSLICHYITDVCMDENAISSDPVIALLLDEKVVIDWSRRIFRSILKELQAIYNLPVGEMTKKLSLLLKMSSKLAGISNVLEVLESSFKDTVSAMLDDLSNLRETVLRTKQHLEIMMWCIRHQFLENVKSRYPKSEWWASSFHERKSAAIKRAWPDPVNQKLESGEVHVGSLFIEDALSNLDVENRHTDRDEGEFVISSLLKGGCTSFFQSRLHGMAKCYPFKSVREAVDLLFLQGNSDLVVAKQAILMYFLFDRHWTMPDLEWRDIVNDFAVTFSMTRHSLLESLVFYLLDDNSDEALKEATHLLPEIAGPSVHPKVAQTLLERQSPDAALMALRWSGRDGGAEVVSIGEAVTSVRVRVECGLLSEAFMYQRMIVAKIRDAYDQVKDQCQQWSLWLEVLVTEICCLCIRRNLVDRMIELPWNLDEEKHLHKCLFDFAINDPSSTTGSLLVVFYLKRYQFNEAYQVDRLLHAAEEDFISKIQNEEVAFRVRSMSHWRRGLAGHAVDLLPDVIQQQLKNGKHSEITTSRNENVPAKSDPLKTDPVLGNLLFKVPTLQ